MVKLMQNEQKSSSLLDGWNSAPNLVTYARIVLMVVFVVLYAMGGAWGGNNINLRWAAAVLFIIAASADKLDGWMARKYNQVTELGKLMDPIADKLLICSTLIVASIFSELSWWVTALFLIREIGITVMRFFVIDKGGNVIAASKTGKYKTLTQSVGLAMLLLPVWALDIWGIDDAAAPSTQDSWGLVTYFTIAYALIYIALVLCLYSGFLYVTTAMASGAFGKKGTAEENSVKEAVELKHDENVAEGEQFFVEPQPVDELDVESHAEEDLGAESTGDDESPSEVVDSEQMGDIPESLDAANIGDNADDEEPEDLFALGRRKAAENAESHESANN